MKFRYKFLGMLLSLGMFSMTGTVNANETKDIKIKKTVESLNLTNENITKEVSSKAKIRSLNVNEKSRENLIIYKINDSSQIVFDKDGNLLNMDRTSELNVTASSINVVDLNKKNEILEQISSILPDGFKLKEEQDLLGGEGIKFVFSNDINGMENKYNVIIVSVENSTGRIITYSKIEEFNEKVIADISIMKAKDIADNYLKENNFYTKYIETKFVIDKVKDSNPKPIYKVIYEDLTIWVDAKDGRVLLFDMVKMDGKAFYITDTFEPENAVNLREIMSILGYNTSVAHVSETAVKSYLSGYDSYGFTFSGHGNSN